MATDSGAFEEYDRVTFERFRELERERPEAGVRGMGMRAVFDNRLGEAGVLSVVKGGKEGELSERVW
jgi:hypothetical protein